MGKLTEQELQEERKIARKASWLNDLFSQHRLTAEEKKEIFIRLAKKVNK